MSPINDTSECRGVLTVMHDARQGYAHCACREEVARLREQLATEQQDRTLLEADRDEYRTALGEAINRVGRDGYAFVVGSLLDEADAACAARRTSRQ